LLLLSGVVVVVRRYRARIGNRTEAGTEIRNGWNCGGRRRVGRRDAGG